jgi:hypothetical protein
LSDRCTTFLTDLPLSPTKLKLCNRTAGSIGLANGL